jgi:hypothetical protein
LKTFVQKLILMCCVVGAAGASAELLYHETFDGDTSDWVGEGLEATIVNGMLDFNVLDSSGTIWLNRKWSGNIQIEYDVLMLGYRDLNCFWMATDPNNPDDFFAADRADGSFIKYDSLDLYYVGYGANMNTTTRGRKYFDNQKPVLVEYTEQPNLLNGENSTYRVRLVQNAGVVEYWIDQNDGRGMQQIWHYDDNADSDSNGDPYTEGYFGIRGARTHYRIDNVTVTAIPEPGTVPLLGLGFFYLYHSRKKMFRNKRKNGMGTVSPPREYGASFAEPEGLEAPLKDIFS